MNAHDQENAQDLTASTAHEMLRDLEASPSELDAWIPVVQHLAQWRGHSITPTDTQRLLTVLRPLVEERALVRRAVREQLSRQHRLVRLLAVARAQVDVLRPTFWLLSAAIVALGAVIEFGRPGLGGNGGFDLYLRALGPLLAYLGIASAFRGVGLRTLEWELACPPSALQLIVARVVIVLGYDVCLGLVFALAGWARGDESPLLVTLHWLMPLLLVAGLALLLSQWLAVPHAAVLAYGAWLALLLLSMATSTGTVSRVSGPLWSLGSELTIGLTGLVLILVAIRRLANQVPRLLSGAQ